MESKEFILKLMQELKGKVEGKKALQKLIYMAQQIFGIKLGYSFKFHYYGPYSSNLAEDFEELLGERKVCLESNSSYVYKLNFNENIDVDNIMANQLTELVSKFGNKKPKELEILATAHFIDNYEKNVHNNYDELKIIEKIKMAKPNFSDEEKTSAYNELKTSNLLKK